MAKSRFPTSEEPEQNEPHLYPLQKAAKISSSEANKKKLLEIHERFKQTPMWARISEKATKAGLLLLQENFKSLGEKVFRIMQLEDTNAAEDPDVIANLRDLTTRRLPRNLTDGSCANFSEIEAQTVIKDSERYIRSEIEKEFGLGRS